MSRIRSSLRRGIIVGGAALILAGSVVGIASAQTTPTPTAPATGQARPSHESFLNALASRLGITSSALEQAMAQARTDVGLPADAPRGLPGFFRGPGGPFGGRGGPGGADWSAAAQAIGITADQLRQELPGKSLAQVAQAHGKTASDVATALKNAAHRRIDQAVTDGRLTADQATQRKQQVDQRIDQQVNEVVPQLPAR